jgi:hypothetical protein
VYRFETPFKVTIEQAGEVVMEAVYGRRTNLKVWPFGGDRIGCGTGLVAECVWPYGATEGVVWEGVDKTAYLRRGMATVTLTAVHDCESCLVANRNVDLIMLTPNTSDIKMRMAEETAILPFDGLISQYGEVFMQVTNWDQHHNITIDIPCPGRPRGRLSGLSVFCSKSALCGGSVWARRALNSQKRRFPARAVAYIHSPYFTTHLILNRSRSIFVEPASTTGWREVGLMLDGLNHGTLNLLRGSTAAQSFVNSTSGEGGYTFIFGVKQDPFDKAADPVIVPLDGGPAFDSRKNDTQVYFDASTRSSRRVRHQTADLQEILASFEAQGDVPGKPLNTTPLFAMTYGWPPRPGGGCGGSPAPGSCAFGTSDPKHADAATNVLKFQRQYTNDIAGFESGGTAHCSSCRSPAGDGSKGMEVISLGDEIQLSGPTTNESFQAFLRSKNVSAASLGCTNISICNMTGPADVPPTFPAGCGFPSGSIMTGAATGTPVSASAACKMTAATALKFYWTGVYAHDAAISHFKNLTATAKNNTANRTVGANITPQKNGWTQSAFIGETFQWVRAYRDGALLLPWSEDWIFQDPLASQQVMTLSIDAMRSGMQWKGTTKHDATTGSDAAYQRKPTPKKHIDMMMYVMKHWPGQTNNSWKRQLFGDLCHGVTMINLFFFETSFEGYTCDYVDAGGGAYPAVREGLHLMGVFEDIVQNGVAQAQGAAAAILYSESADIFKDTLGTYGAGLRTLYLALRHAESPVDIVIEFDVSGLGLLEFYSALYVTMPHMTVAAAAATSAWVARGGTVFATASAGLLDEANQTNIMFSHLLGVNQTGILTGRYSSFIMGGQDNRSVFFTKQDLKFVEVLDEVKLSNATGPPLVVKGLKSVFSDNVNDTAQVTVLARFASTDGGQAARIRHHGLGKAYYTAFLPGLSYYEPAIPVRPVDRSSMDSGFTHFIPTLMDASARALIAAPLLGVAGAVPVSSTEPLVEVGVITAGSIGTAMPCVNWSGGPIANFTITLHFELSYTTVSLASGGAITASADRKSFTFSLSDTIDAVVFR